MAISGIATAYDDFTAVDTTQRMALGSEVHVGNKAYVYVQGVTSGAANKAVTFTSAGVTTLTVADANGRVGILMAALDATTKYGFAQVFGPHSTASAGTSAADGVAVYLTSTGGQLDGADVAGDQVHGAIWLGDDAAGVAPIHLNYPYVIDAATD